MVPPFFLPLYGAEFGLSTLSSAALVSGFNLASGLGRVLFGQLADYIGPVNALILAMSSNGIALLVLWPVSMSLAPLIIFVIVSGISAGEPVQTEDVETIQIQDGVDEQAHSSPLCRPSLLPSPIPQSWLLDMVCL